MINYEDFAKLEITIGKVIEAEIVEDADKLLKLTVDFGHEDVRQVISGIREYYPNPEDIVGIRCPFLTNLEPRVIRGLESQAMILAASTEEAFSLLVPSSDIVEGSRVV